MSSHHMQEKTLVLFGFWCVCLCVYVCVHVCAHAHACTMLMFTFYRKDIRDIN